MGKILIIEPFYGGSHKQLVENMISGLSADEYHLLTLPAKKWPWKARCSALYLYESIPDLKEFSVLFCSSVLNLAELIGLRSDLARLYKIVYFHENQLIYPVRKVKDRDFQYGYNQITTCIAADSIIFNSEFNRSSFFGNINSFLKMMPDFKKRDIGKIIYPKTKVLYFLMKFPVIETEFILKPKQNSTLHIVWPHRWEFDKNPGLFFDTLYKLKERNVPFQVSVLGQSFSEEPIEFKTARLKLKEEIKVFGFVETQKDYFRVLSESDIVVSTADHEFFGVSILEAVHCGCVPLLPNKLVYPELYPKEYLYNNRDELLEKLCSWCRSSEIFSNIKQHFKFDTTEFNTEHLLPEYLSLLRCNPEN